MSTPITLTDSEIMFLSEALKIASQEFGKRLSAIDGDSGTELSLAIYFNRQMRETDRLRDLIEDARTITITADRL